jgi:hypothetical protein
METKGKRRTNSRYESRIRPFKTGVDFVDMTKSRIFVDLPRYLPAARPRRRVEATAFLLPNVFVMIRMSHDSQYKNLLTHIEDSRDQAILVPGHVEHRAIADLARAGTITLHIVPISPRDRAAADTLVPSQQRTLGISMSMPLPKFLEA